MKLKIKQAKEPKHSLVDTDSEEGIHPKRCPRKDEEVADSDDRVINGEEKMPHRREVRRQEFKMKIKASQDDIKEFERFSKHVDEIQHMFDEMSCTMKNMRELCSDQRNYAPMAELEFSRLKDEVDNLSKRIRRRILAHQKEEDIKKGPFAEAKAKILGTLVNELVLQMERFKEVPSRIHSDRLRF